jgi:predicted amidohydrolase
MRVAIAQARPATLDLEAGVERAVEWIRRAGREGVALLAFGESFLGGYPAWVDWAGWSAFGSRDNARLFTRLRAASVTVLPQPREAIRVLSAACAEAGVAVVIGADERSPEGKSIYNSLLVFDRHGVLRQVRRKLVPTHGERLCWAPAPDAAVAALEAVDLDGVPVGALMCWEHWMPLARHRLHRTGEALHVAAWPHGSELHHLASRHYAFEGACFVLLSALYAPPEDFAALDLGLSPPDGWRGLDGGSAIVGPDARYRVEPVYGREDLLVADLDLREAEEAAFLLDTAGHYDRRDLLSP